MDKDTCITFLRDLVSQNAPFSACAIACVNSLAPDDIKEKLALDI
jgi:beta-lactamase class D